MFDTALTPPSTALPSTALLSTALSSLLVESRLHPAGTVLVGDPAVLAGGPAAGAGAGAGAGGSSPFTSLVTGGGLAAEVRQADPTGSAFVWVGGGAGGAVRRVTAAFALDALGAEPAFVGHVDCPSGRLVVGTPEAVAAWGDDVEPGDGFPAQARAYRSDRRYCGLVVVARVPPGPHPVFALGSPGRLDGVVVDVMAHEPELRLAG